MRIVKDLNSDWLFSKTCQAAPDTMPDGNGWSRVTLPHSWNAIDGQDGSPFDRGAFWYVTSFVKPEQPLEGGRVYIEVGAASLVGEIWVNGKFQTRHVGGFSAFRADVTDACHDGENVLAILCDNSYSDKVYPQRADFTFYGGLYRGVKIISAPATRFNLDYLGSSGVFIDTMPEDNGAKISVRAMLTNAVAKQMVSIEILDADNNVVCEDWAFAQENIKENLHIPGARLWNGVDDPYMYRARLRIVSYNEVLDEIEIPFGIRAFAVDCNRGYILNGVDYPLRGVCRHQDRLYEGNALSREEHFEDAKLIADMGANCIRLAHYQQSNDIYDACDELGLVVWAEIPYFARTWDDDAHASSINEIKEMCAQNYNHPSICFWGLSNEILLGNNDNPKLIPCHNDLADAVRSIDTTRLTVAAHDYSHPWDHELHNVTDVEGWNHYFGWYRGEPEDLGKWLDEYHSKYPDRRISISEYGCDCVLLYHTEKPAKMDYTEEYQVYIHEKALEEYAKRPWVWGTFVWNMFDFGSGFRREGGTRGRNNKGLATIDRKILKDSYYVYKAWFGKDPFVHVDGRRFFDRPGKTTNVVVHSNLKQVSLYVDGKFFAKLQGDKRFVFENVPISAEGTSITAKSGDYMDTIMLKSVDALEDYFTFPNFKKAVDATNWFVSIEETVGTLEPKEGFFSVHDKMKDIMANEEASTVLMKCLIASITRSVPDDFLESASPDQTVAEFCTDGRAGFMLKQLKETTIRRIHTALLQVAKK